MVAVGKEAKKKSLIRKWKKSEKNFLITKEQNECDAHLIEINLALKDDLNYTWTAVYQAIIGQRSEGDESRKKSLIEQWEKSENKSLIRKEKNMGDAQQAEHHSVELRCPRL